MDEPSGRTRRIWTLSNAITLSRAIVGGPIAWEIVRSGGEPSIWVVLLFVLAGVSDGVDGYIARLRQEVTNLGIMLDPVADKIFGTLIFAALVVAGLLPAWLFWVLIVKELALLVGGVVMLKGRGRTLSARFLGKIATVILFVSFGLLLIGVQTVGFWLAFIGVFLSVGAGIDYAIQVGGEPTE